MLAFVFPHVDHLPGLFDGLKGGFHNSGRRPYKGHHRAVRRLARVDIQ